MSYKDRFKKFGGDFIPDVIEYLKDYIKSEPNVTITIGCDSIQKRSRTLYAITIMLYNGNLHNGAHVIFYRESCMKIRDNDERLYKEAKYVHDVATYINDELEGFYKRSDLSDLNRKKYKFHLLKCNGEHLDMLPHNEDAFVNRLTLLPEDKIEFKLVDIHVDFNPREGTINGRGVSKNKSFAAYKSYTPWLRGLGFRTWAKPDATASSTGADLLLRD